MEQVIKYKLKRLFRPRKSQRNQNQNQIPCLQNHTEQNLRTQLTDGTIATVRLEDVKAKVS